METQCTKEVTACIENKTRDKIQWIDACESSDDIRYSNLGEQDCEQHNGDEYCGGFGKSWMFHSDIT